MFKKIHFTDLQNGKMRNKAYVFQQNFLPLPAMRQNILEMHFIINNGKYLIK